MLPEAKSVISESKKTLLEMELEPTSCFSTTSGQHSHSLLVLGHLTKMIKFNTHIRKAVLRLKNTYICMGKTTSLNVLWPFGVMVVLVLKI